MEKTAACAKCKLNGFCFQDNGTHTSTDTIWENHQKELPQGLPDDIGDRLLKKAQNRKRRDKSIYPLVCYYAVLLYQLIEDEGRDHYIGKATDDKERGTIDWSKAGEGAKIHAAPAIDHINPNCKNPIDDNGEPNLAFCRNDVNDAKNDLSTADFVKLCRAVVAWADKRSQSGAANQ